MQHISMKLFSIQESKKEYLTTHWAIWNDVFIYISIIIIRVIRVEWNFTPFFLPTLRNMKWYICIHFHEIYNVIMDEGNFTSVLKNLYIHDYIKITYNISFMFNMNFPFPYRHDTVTFNDFWQFQYIYYFNQFTPIYQILT